MKDLTYWLEIICEKLNLSCDYDNAKERNLSFYLQLNYVLVYGGYQLVRVNVDGGGHSSFANLSYDRRSKKEMLFGLRCIVAGIDLGKTNF